jgi:hypothetical protein
MTKSGIIGSATLILGLALGTAGEAIAQGLLAEQALQQEQPGPMMRPGTMLGQGMPPGPPPGLMMRPGAIPGQGMLSAPPPGPPPGAMMGEPIFPQFGVRVVPTLRLSADDVRAYLARALTNQGFDRLKVGAVEEVDDNTITAEIVTADNSLAHRLKIDRHTGVISRAG